MGNGGDQLFKVSVVGDGVISIKKEGYVGEEFVLPRLMPPNLKAI